MIRWHGMAGVACALALAHAAAGAAVGSDVALDLAKKSGLWLQLDSLGAQVRAGMASSLAKGGDAQGEARRTRLLACADTAYGADAMRATAVDAVAGALQPADVPALLAWYDSALGHKVAGMEEASAAQVADPAERLRRGQQALGTASAARKASLQTILTETRSVDVMADTVIESAVAVRQGLAGANGTATAVAMSDIRADLSARRPELVARYSQMALPAYAFAYAGLADDELKRYADYLAGAGARAYNDATVRGVARALSDGAFKLGRCLKDVAAKP